jgi:hypothetical protein
MRFRFPLPRVRGVATPGSGGGGEEGVNERGRGRGREGGREGEREGGREGGGEGGRGMAMMCTVIQIATLWF